MELLAENHIITKMSLKWQVLFFYPREVLLRVDTKIEVIVKTNVI